VNLYAYCGNSPVDRNDPTGMFGLLVSSGSSSYFPTSPNNLTIQSTGYQFSYEQQIGLGLLASQPFASPAGPALPANGMSQPTSVVKPQYQNFSSQAAFFDAKMAYVASFPTKEQRIAADDDPAFWGANAHFAQIEDQQLFAQIDAKQAADQKAQSAHYQQLQADYEAQVAKAQAAAGNGAFVGQGGYSGGALNPGNWRRWAYTGYADSSDNYYNVCVTGGGQRLSTMGVGISVSANAAISTPVGGFTTGGPNLSLVFHFGTGELSAYGGWNWPTFEASSNKFAKPISWDVNATGMVIDNLHSPSDLKGPALGFTATVIGPKGVGANVVYAQNIPTGPTIYGFGPSWGSPGASIDVPQLSFTTPPMHVANLYGL